MSAWETILSTGVGAVVGGGAVVFGQFLTAKHEGERARSAWDRDRQAIRNDAERDAICRLQESLHELGRQAAISIIEDTVLFREHKEWGIGTKDPEKSEALRATNMRVQMLASRLSDPEIRQLVQTAQTLAGMAAASDSWSQAEARMKDVTQAAWAVDKRVTVLLATL